jgi:hypothetical protein
MIRKKFILTGYLKLMRQVSEFFIKNTIKSSCFAKKTASWRSCFGRKGSVTAENCMNASWTYAPTIFVFPHQRAKQELFDDAPPGTTAEYHPSGRMKKIFCEMGPEIC